MISELQSELGQIGNIRSKWKSPMFITVCEDGTYVFHVYNAVKIQTENPGRSQDALCVMFSKNAPVKYASGGSYVVVFKRNFENDPSLDQTLHINTEPDSRDPDPYGRLLHCSSLPNGLYVVYSTAVRACSEGFRFKEADGPSGEGAFAVLSNFMHDTTFRDTFANSLYDSVVFTCDTVGGNESSTTVEPIGLIDYKLKACRENNFVPVTCKGSGISILTTKIIEWNQYSAISFAELIKNTITNERAKAQLVIVNSVTDLYSGLISLLSGKSGSRGKSGMLKLKQWTTDMHLSPFLYEINREWEAILFKTYNVYPVGSFVTTPTRRGEEAFESETRFRTIEGKHISPMDFVAWNLCIQTAMGQLPQVETFITSLIANGVVDDDAENLILHLKAITGLDSVENISRTAGTKGIRARLNETYRSFSEKSSAPLVRIPAEIQLGLSDMYLDPGFTVGVKKEIVPFAYTMVSQMECYQTSAKVGSSQVYIVIPANSEPLRDAFGDIITKFLTIESEPEEQGKSFKAAYMYKDSESNWQLLSANVYVWLQSSDRGLASVVQAQVDGAHYMIQELQKALDRSKIMRTKLYTECLEGIYRASQILMTAPYPGQQSDDNYVEEHASFALSEMCLRISEGGTWGPNHSFTIAINGIGRLNELFDNGIVQFVPMQNRWSFAQVSLEWKNRRQQLVDYITEKSTSGSGVHGSNDITYLDAFIAMDLLSRAFMSYIPLMKSWVDDQVQEQIHSYVTAVNSLLSECGLNDVVNTFTELTPSTMMNYISAKAAICRVHDLGLAAQYDVASASRFNLATTDQELIFIRLNSGELQLRDLLRSNDVTRLSAISCMSQLIKSKNYEGSPCTGMMMETINNSTVELSVLYEKSFSSSSDSIMQLFETNLRDEIKQSIISTLEKTSGVKFGDVDVPITIMVNISSAFYISLVSPRFRTTFCAIESEKKSYLSSILSNMHGMLSSLWYSSYRKLRETTVAYMSRERKVAPLLEVRDKSDMIPWGVLIGNANPISDAVLHPYVSMAIATSHLAILSFTSGSVGDVALVTAAISSAVYLMKRSVINLYAEANKSSGADLSDIIAREFAILAIYGGGVFIALGSSGLGLNTFGEETGALNVYRLICGYGNKLAYYASQVFKWIKTSSEALSTIASYMGPSGTKTNATIALENALNNMTGQDAANFAHMAEVANNTIAARATATELLGSLVGKAMQTGNITAGLLLPNPDASLAAGESVANAIVSAGANITMSNATALMGRLMSLTSFQYNASDMGKILVLAQLLGAALNSNDALVAVNRQLIEARDELKQTYSTVLDERNEEINALRWQRLFAGASVVLFAASKVWSTFWVSSTDRQLNAINRSTKSILNQLVVSETSRTTVSQGLLNYFSRKLERFHYSTADMPDVTPPASYEPPVPPQPRPQRPQQQPEPQPERYEPQERYEEPVQPSRPQPQPPESIQQPQPTQTMQLTEEQARLRINDLFQTRVSRDDFRSMLSGSQPNQYLPRAVASDPQKMSQIRQIVSSISTRVGGNAAVGNSAGRKKTDELAVSYAGGPSNTAVYELMGENQDKDSENLKEKKQRLISLSYGNNFPTSSEIRSAMNSVPDYLRGEVVSGLWKAENYTRFLHSLRYIKKKEQLGMDSVMKLPPLLRSVGQDLINALYDQSVDATEQETDDGELTERQQNYAKMVIDRTFSFLK
jgi:hypothetical protein